MTESKLSARNTYTDTIPVNETLSPHKEVGSEISRDEEFSHVESSGDFIRRVITIIIGLFSMIALTFPLLIIPGTILIVLPLEVAIIDLIYGEAVIAKKLLEKQPIPETVSDSISNLMERDQIRVTVYGKRSPG
jgi:hypothetical protein